MALIGRSRELAEIGHLLDRVGGGLLVVVGAPGSGRTALADEAATLGRQRGFEVVRASVTGVNSGLLVWAQVLRDLGDPADVAEGFEFFKWFPSDEKDQLRRTIYTFQRRSVVMTMMEVFDGANMSESCARRNVTTVAPQAFTLLNSDFTNAEAKHFAARVIELAGPDPERQIERAFRMALSRPPSRHEIERAQATMAGMESREALARLSLVLFNLNEFMYLE